MKSFLLGLPRLTSFCASPLHASFFEVDVSRPSCSNPHFQALAAHFARGKVWFANLLTLIRREKTMRSFAFTLALLLSLCFVSAQAQQKRAMTFEDILALKNVSDAQVSPDGRWVAYVVTTIDLKEDAADADVWVVSTSGGNPIRLTTNKKTDRYPRWSPDGKLIAFISEREASSPPPGSDQRAKPQIYL